MKTELKDLAAKIESYTLDEYLKANDAAQFLNVSRRTFERMRALNQIPHIRCGGGRVLRYRRKDLIEAMGRMTVR